MQMVLAQFAFDVDYAPGTVQNVCAAKVEIEVEIVARLAAVALVAMSAAAVVCVRY